MIYNFKNYPLQVYGVPDFERTKRLGFLLYGKRHRTDIEKNFERTIV